MIFIYLFLSVCSVQGFAMYLHLTHELSDQTRFLQQLQLHGCRLDQKLGEKRGGEGGVGFPKHL